MDNGWTTRTPNTEGWWWLCRRPGEVEAARVFVRSNPDGSERMAFFDPTDPDGWDYCAAPGLLWGEEIVMPTPPEWTEQELEESDA